MGTYEDAIGTFMFFDKENDPKIDDPVFDKPSTLRYYKKSRKILKMKRVFVNPRLEILGDSNHPKCIPNIETIKEAGVPPKYQNDALSVWEKMRNEVIEVRNDYLEKQEKRKEKRQRGIELDSESDEDNYYVSMYKSKVENRKNKDKNIQESDKNKSQLLNKTGPSTLKDNLSDVSFENDQVTDESEDQEDSDISGSGQVAEKMLQQKTTSNLIPRNKELMDDEEIDPELEGMDVEMSVPGTSTTSVDNTQLKRNKFKINQEKPSENISNPESDKEEGSPTLSADQKHKKQKKREAKMQEITERFRRSANLVKLKSDQTKD